ncbi:MAG: hypothetical protein MZU97_12225 [Bacillus subtilis]|nr:hypothetical protein [Bacillus subtilis]
MRRFPSGCPFFRPSQGARRARAPETSSTSVSEDLLIEGDIGARAAVDAVSELRGYCRREGILEEAGVRAALKSVLGGIRKGDPCRADGGRPGCHPAAGCERGGQDHDGGECQALVSGARAGPEHHPGRGGYLPGGGHRPAQDPRTTAGHARGGTADGLVIPGPSCTTPSRRPRPTARTSSWRTRRAGCTRSTTWSGSSRRWTGSSGPAPSLPLQEASGRGRNHGAERPPAGGNLRRGGAAGRRGPVQVRLLRKGGIVISLAYERGIPTAFLGTGEEYDDIKPFSLVEFLDDLLGTRD